MPAKLHRRYEPVAARLATPRGRLDLQTLARDGIISAELPCRHYPRVEDCLHNQVLLAGLRLAAEIACDRDLRSELRRTAPIIENDVSQTISVSPATIARLRRRANRLTVAYEPAISLIEILLDSSGVSLQGALQQPKVPGFLFDMNRFFQRLLGRFLRENLPDHHVQEEKAIRGMMAYSPEYNPRACRARPRSPTTVSGPKEGKTLLLDAKYRDLWSEDLPRRRCCTKLAIYALSQRPTPRRATILYPTMNSAASDSVIRIFEPSSGNPRAEVIQHPVSLAWLAALLAPGRGIYEARQRQGVRLEIGCESVLIDHSPHPSHRFRPLRRRPDTAPLSRFCQIWRSVCAVPTGGVAETTNDVRAVTFMSSSDS